MSINTDTPPKQNTERAKKLQSYLESKRDFIGFVQTLNSLKDSPQDPFLPDEEISFLVFANEPTIIFNLRDYLLVLVQMFNQQASVIVKTQKNAL